MSDKLFLLIRRAQHLAREEFSRRYLEEYGPLVLRHCPKLHRYVVNLTDPPREGGSGPDETFDAIEELWFDSLDDYTDRARLYDSAEGASAVEERVAGLIDSVVAYHVAERVQRDYQRTWNDGERSPGMKLVAPLRRAEGLSHEQFVDHWLNRHVALALKHVLGIGRYVTNVVVAPLAPGAPEFDGIVEVHYLEKRRFDSPEGEAIMAADTASFLRPPLRHRVGEYVLRG